MWYNYTYKQHNYVQLGMVKDFIFMMKEMDLSFFCCETKMKSFTNFLFSTCFEIIDRFDNIIDINRITYI